MDPVELLDRQLQALSAPVDGDAAHAELQEARRLIAERDEDGTWSGIVGGGVATDQIMNVAMMADAMQGEQISPALRALLPRWVDMGKGEDGRCTQLSAALLFESQPAFVYPDVEL